jgi:hypothetical protein
MRCFCQKTNRGGGGAGQMPQEDSGGLQRLYSKRNVGYGGPYAGADYNPTLSYLVVVSEVQLSTPCNYKGKGVGVGKVSSIGGWEHLDMSAKFHNMFFMSKGKGRESMRKGEGRGGS